MNEEAGRLWLGAAAGAAFMPILVLAFDAPLWLGAAGAFGLFLGSLFLLRRPLPAWPWRAKATAALPGFDGLPALRAALSQAEPALARLERCAELARPPMADKLQRMADIGRGVIAQIRQEPARLAIVQRLLTYYLPSTADIAEGYCQLAGDGLAPRARLAAAESLLQRLEAAIGHFASQLMHQDLRDLDAEIRLIDAALKEDLGDRP